MILGVERVDRQLQKQMGRVTNIGTQRIDSWKKKKKKKKKKHKVCELQVVALHYSGMTTRKASNGNTELIGTQVEN